MTTRSQLLPLIRAAFGGRPVRWADTRALGDYDGRERTLEVFNTDVREQLDLLTRFRSLRPDVETAAGGPVIVIFHTTRETARLYADVLAAHDHERLAVLARKISERLPAAQIEVQRNGDIHSGIIVRLAGRSVLIENNIDTGLEGAGAGFEIRLIRVPGEDADPDFRTCDPERTLRMVEFLISQQEEETRFSADLEHVPEPSVEDADPRIADPPDLKIEDRRVDMGTTQPPRRAA